MKGKARPLRKHQTEAEKRLWYHLRNREMKGCKFRRQHPIGIFVADFVCIERGLVVEVDGGQHNTEIAEDKKRTAYLESKGFRVVRFWNNDVLNDTGSVLRVILSVLEDNTPLTPALSPYSVERENRKAPGVRCG